MKKRINDADPIDPDVLIHEHHSAQGRERSAITNANNILSNLKRAEGSWLKYAPPKVRGRLLDIFCFDYGPSFWDICTMGYNRRERAILSLLEVSPSWRDYEETVTRINTEGTKGSFAHNRTRLRNLMRLFPSLQIDRIESKLGGKRAVPNQPVQLAKHVQFTGTYYA